MTNAEDWKIEHLAICCSFGRLKRSKRIKSRLDQMMLVGIESEILSIKLADQLTFFCTRVRMKVKHTEWGA